MRKKVFRVIGWILFGYGILGALYALTTNPVHLLYELPLIVLCIGGGWVLAHMKGK